MVLLAYSTESKSLYIGVLYEPVNTTELAVSFFLHAPKIIYFDYEWWLVQKNANMFCVDSVSIVIDW